MAAGTSRWPARSIQASILCGGVLLFFGLLSPFMLTKFILLPHVPSNDYFAFYSFSRFIHQYPAALIYDPPVLERLQAGLHGVSFPFLYPPGILLLVWPLSYLTFSFGYLWWIGPGLAGYLVAIGLTGPRRVSVVAALVAPSTAWTIMCGQTALFGAALLFGGFRLLPRRPVLAGLLFGVLTYKPQLALLVPVALVAASQWRCLLATCITAIMVILGSATAFGVDTWGAWLHDLPALARIIAKNMLVFCPLMATVTSNLLVFGVPAAGAHIVQAIVTLAACGVVWSCLRTGVSMLGAAAVAVATFLATPYAFGYDMPLLTGAVIVVVGDCHKRDGSFAFWEVMVLLASFLLPFCVLVSVLFRLSSVVVMALLWLIARRNGAAGMILLGVSATEQPAMLGC